MDPVNPLLPAFADATFIIAIALPVIAGLLGFLLLFLVIRNAIASGLRKHQLWMEHRAEQQGEHHHRHAGPAQQAPPA